MLQDPLPTKRQRFTYEKNLPGKKRKTENNEEEDYTKFRKRKMLSKIDCCLYQFIQLLNRIGWTFLWFESARHRRFWHVRARPSKLHEKDTMIDLMNVSIPFHHSSRSTRAESEILACTTSHNLLLTTLRTLFFINDHSEQEKR